MVESELVDLTEASRQLGRSPDAVRRVLKRNPGIEAGLFRRWGKRLLGPQDIEAIREAFEAREVAAK